MKHYSRSLCLAFTLALISIESSSAQTCTTNVYQNAPTERFTMLDDEVVDSRTGLVWQRCLGGQVWNAETTNCDMTATSKNWKEALESAPEGWRLPNIKELMSLVEHSCAFPALNTTVFPMTDEAVTEGYAIQWSSTANKNSTFFGVTSSKSWYFSFLLGDPQVDEKNTYRYVRYVKDYEIELEVE